MKIRNGFVSNSSSSSFVIVGVKQIDGDYEEISDSLPSDFSCLYIDNPNYAYISGLIISDDEHLEDSCTSFAELKEMSEKVATGLNVDISQVELMVGTYPC